MRPATSEPTNELADRALQTLTTTVAPKRATRIVYVILALAPELQRSRNNTNTVVILVVQLIVLIIGLVGSWRDNRQLLLTFAIILTVLVIISVVQSQAIAVVGNAVLDILSILLAVYQSEMIRSGDL